MSADSEPPPPAKYSRYRSVRQAVATSSPPPVDATQPHEVQNEAIQRSRSRYHRRPAVSSSTAPGGVPIPILPQHLPTLQTTQGEIVSSLNNQIEETRPKRSTTTSVENSPQKRYLRDPSRPDPRIRERSEERASINQRQNIAQALPLRGHGEQVKLAKVHLPEEDEVARKLAEQKQKDLQRLEMELAAAATRPSVSPERSNSTMQKPNMENFRVFTRKRAESKAAPSKSPSSSTEAESQGAREVKSDEPSKNILQGGGGVGPGVDAPKSAVNAGERRVLVRCKQCSINLPVTPETTPVDLIASAANVLSVVITPSTSILLESYLKLGLERRIRRYEHVREIMNSWDRDTQNALVIQASDSPGHDLDLEASSVPRLQPNDITVYMYHSQRPGKWSKRYITLDSTGQIFVAKKKDAKVTDKDILTLCHLTDFDIYTPNADEIHKNIRPPKKYCYAIKSQQKTNMFLNAEKFVHFFSTDDYNIANKWYDACQKWRSWYLVNVKGEGQKKAAIKVRTVKMPGIRTATDGPALAGHKVQISIDQNPYTIGSFTPLMDLNRFDGTNQDPNDEVENIKPRQVPFHLRNSITPPGNPTRRDRHPPPVSYRLPSTSAAITTEQVDDSSTFAATGLLGRTYSQRQHSNLARGLGSLDGPFTSGPSLLNAAPPDTTAFHHPKSADPLLPLSQSPSTHKRSLSTATRAARPKTSAGASKVPLSPLVDLTPKFVEAPQWSREGKGHGVAAPRGGAPLVEGARGPAGTSPVEGVLFRRE